MFFLYSKHCLRELELALLFYILVYIFFYFLIFIIEQNVLKWGSSRNVHLKCVHIKSVETRHVFGNLL